MNIRHLRFFVTLERERHFGRAAAKCNVTQPTLSEAIRQLERELSAPLINRDRQRYGGLTPEGERVLAAAQNILANQDVLEQELAQMRDKLSGELRFGVIPAATTVAPLITAPFTRRHPMVTPLLLDYSSIDIERALEAGELDAGLTYLDNEPIRNVRSFPLYRERYMLLTPAGERLGRQSTATWREAATLPMCLLTRDMQNRRIVDRLFAEGGAGTIRAAVETDSVLSLIAHVQTGGWSSVVPHTFLMLLARQGILTSGLHAVSLTAPDAQQTVGIVVSDRDPLPPLAQALVGATGKTDIQGEIDRLISRIA